MHVDILAEYVGERKRWKAAYMNTLNPLAPSRLSAGGIPQRLLETGNSTEQGTVLLPLWLVISTLIRIDPALADGYLPFAHFFPSSVCSTKDIYSTYQIVNICTYSL